MSHRGLTLIELLVSLALLSALVAAITTWTTMAGRMSSTAMEPARRLAGVQDVLQLIHDDLASGDFAPLEKSTPAPRVVWNQSVLQIHTRSQFGTSHAYHFDKQTNQLRFEPAQSNTGNSSNDSTRTLLESVMNFECEIDVEQRTLAVVITLQDGAVGTRRYWLP